MNILHYISGKDGCGYYRCVVPSLAINQYKGYQAHIKTIFSKEAIDWADVIIFQKQYKDDAWYWFQYALNQKKIVLYEADDDYFNIPDWNPTHTWFRTHISKWERFMRAADGIIVSTSHLKKQFSHLNQNIYVHPNAIDFNLIQKIEKGNPLQKVFRVDSNYQKIELMREEIEQSKKDGYIHIGWGGSPTHQRDLAIIEEVLFSLMRQYSNIKVFNIGYTLNWLAKNAPKDQFIMIEGVDVEYYLPLLDFCQLDIGIAPLEDNIFNRSKSNLKILEYMSLKMAVVASDVGNYQLTLKNHPNCGILVENKKKVWLKEFKKLISNETLREDLKLNGYQLTKNNYNAYKLAADRIKLFEDLRKKNGQSNHSQPLSS